MEQMKQRFVNAVAAGLSAAPESTAKGELVEELAENLYRRYLDMTAAGMAEGEAFEKALDELGDTGELVDYLNSLAPDESIPKLTLHPDGLDAVVEQAMQTAKEAMAAAQEALRKAGRKLNWRSADGQFEVHVDGFDDDHGEHPHGEDHEDESQETEDREVSFKYENEKTGKTFEIGYNKAKGGFYTRNEPGNRFETGGEAEFTFVDDEEQEIGAEGIPSEGLRGLDIQTAGGDVTLHLIEDGDAPIFLEDWDGLEVRRTDDGVLTIRQENTASSNFFFGRGIFSPDVELSVPRRLWDFLRVTTGSGDVTVEDGMEVEELTVRTASGDLNAECGRCARFAFKSASGDVEASGLAGRAEADTASGDVTLSGHLEQVRVQTASGDVEVSGAFLRGQFTSLSGDVNLETAELPRELTARSTSGDCRVCLPDGEGFTLRCRSTSGDLSSQFRLQRTERGHVYGDGGDRTFHITTTSGDVRLRKF